MPARRKHVQYLLVITHDDSFTPAETLIKEIGAWIKKMECRGVRVYGNPPRPPGDGATVRVREGKVVLTKRPFAKSEGKMRAHELIGCPSSGDAIDVASQHPIARAPMIEVRRIWDELAG
jgi:hypothetical protein